MALEAPLRSSTGNIISSFSSHPDISISSPDSSLLQLPFRPMSSGPIGSGSRRPASTPAIRSSSAYHLMSPSDMLGPSSVTSIGTAATEIEDEVSEEGPTANIESQSRLRTNLPEHVRQMAGEEAVSVIHAPDSYQNWARVDSPSKQSGSIRRYSPRQSPNVDEIVVASPSDRDSEAKSIEPPTPPSLSTDVKPVRCSNDNATPRAQNLREVVKDSSRIRSGSASSLELIPESKEPEIEVDLGGYDEREYPTLIRGDSLEDTGIRPLQAALQECWTLCNTLASLSTHHRERVFSTSGTSDGREKAWKCCWKLCQRLYDSRNEADESFNVRVNLDLCRDFCQALFDVRTRQDESSDSVLRVSFELNNHLYSAQDNRNLPDAFRERTLDFYITLCHRLMKQRGQLTEETNSLLRACWSLAEMLFSLRQNKRDGKAPDEELLGSAVQACWELCDIFREGWTQIRPDRGTPRPTQPNFSREREVDIDDRASRLSNRSRRDNSRRDSIEKPRQPLPVPETPVTEFEDTPISPDGQSPQAPNILVLGTETINRGGRWPSSASNLSGYSQSSQRTSSTVTSTTGTENINIMRIKVLILKAAITMGFSRDKMSDGHGNAISLQTFVKCLPAGSFGSLPLHATLLQDYKNLVVADSSFGQASSLPPRGRRVFAMDMAKSLTIMMDQPGPYNFDFLRDLFKIVYGFRMEDSDSHPNNSISV
ncbi:hypothetical protein F4861DRAFT_477680 [Xylaria intraflava]|nr:hypothetical protein F4861DRAFT_477680 [Xylaria intraflava]